MMCINKLNLSLKYNININNRNIVAAICAIEFFKLKPFVIDHADDKVLSEFIRLAQLEMCSNVPMRLSIVDDIMPIYKSTNIRTHSNYAYYGVTNLPLIKIACDSNSNTVMAHTKNNEYFVYKYPVDFPKLEMIIMNDSFDIIQAFDYSEEYIITESGDNVKMRVYTSANPGAFNKVKLSFK